MIDLRAQPGALALALEWIVLSSARATEGLAATWGEIDREAKVWTIPADRMKGEAGKRREHQVPLSAAMLDVLDGAAPKDGSTPKPGTFLFPSRTHAAGWFDRGAALDLLRDLRPGALTVHGFRSAFFDWSQEATDYSDRLVNAALAHVVRDKVQRAYDRSKLVEKRRPLMADWGAYCLALCIPAANTDTAGAQAEAA